GERVVKPRDFFVTYLTTSLAPDEIVVEVRLPATDARAGAVFEEFSRRHGDFAIVGIAAVIARDGERCTMARLATAGAGPVPVRPAEIDAPAEPAHRFRIADGGSSAGESEGA